MTASRQTLVFLSALLIGFTLLGNEPLSNARFESTELILPAIGGIEYRAERFSGVDLGNDSFSWTGKIKSARSGFVSLAVVNGESTVTVSFADGITYSFRGELENLVLKPLVSSHQVCGGCVAVADGELPVDPRMGAQPMLSWQNGDANLIDLLVVYPASVRSDAGGTSAIQAEIVKAVADSNLCYRNSQVNVQLRLVHMEEVSYTPTGLLETDLSRLKATNDGHIDNVHALRDSYGADLVALLTTASNSGGLASTLMHPSLDFESSGFSVNVWTQISAPSYTLAHEIGHNMGCLHNIEDSSGVTSQYDYAAFCYGKRWLNSGQGYKTVMSYDTNPSSTYPITIPYFSNPDIDYQGMATGNQGSADNAQVLSSTAPYVSNFRASVVQGILPNLFDSEVGEGNYSNILIRLSAKPSSPVTVTISISGDSDLILTSASTLSFNSSNWNLPHTIQVYAKPDTDGSSDTGTLLLTAPGIPSVSVSLVEVDNGSNTSTGFLLTGVVANELGIGLGGVSLSLSNGGGLTTSDLDGSFLINLPLNWSGLVTPSRAGYSFSPSNLSLGAVTADSVGHLIVASRLDVLFVDSDAVGAGDGTSWMNAYTDLGDALRETTVFTEVWVADGTYKAGMVRSSTFLIPPHIAVYGGFSGNEVSRVNRDVLANVTILSGDLGILNNNTDNAFHVVVPSQGAVLDGFTITGGNASENFSDDRGKGAGLWADSASITVSNCKFISNNAYQGGAAIYLKDVNGTFSNCEIISNTTNSTGSGAGLYLEDSNVSLTSSIFSDNQAHFHAGAIRSENSEINLLNCSLSSNRSLTSNGGGAMYLNGGSFSIKSTSFTNNQATFQGGAILISGASGSIEDSNFTGNQNTNSNGGGALLIENSSPSILRCRFIENSTSANNHGGAIKLDTSSASITDSIFIGNRSLTNSAGAIYFDSSSSPSFSNNEFRLNSAAQFGGAIFVNGSNLNLTGDLFLGNYANLGGGIATQGTMSVSLSNVRALGNEANSSSSSSAGFIYLNSGVTSSTFVNSVFSGNKSLGRYGVYRSSGPSRFVNCSIVGNEAGTDGGVTLMFAGDSIELDNSIVWNNTAGNGNDIWVNDGTATANYSLFNPSQSMGTISGSNNLNIDPLFVDANGVDNISGTSDDNLALQSTSPAINSGLSSVANYSSLDLTGRIRDANTDMGSYEYSSNVAPVFSSSTNISVSENQTAVIDINSTDSDGDGLSYSLSGGEDQAKFQIDSSSGILSFLASPDFESPTDSNGDGIYKVIVSVSDGIDTIAQELTVSVVDGIDAVETFTVSGGQFSSPYFSITNSQGSAVDFSTYTFQKGSTYYFVALNISGSHPFMIGESYGNTSSSLVSGGPLNSSGNGERIILSIPFGFNGQLLYFCTNHSSMKQNLLISNQSPVISSGNDPLSLTLAQRESISYDLNATDADGDTLSWSVSSATSNGSSSIDSSTGVLSYTPTTNFNGSDSLVVQVSDGSLTDTLTINLSISASNAAPVISESSSTLSLSMVEDGTFAYDLNATDADSDSLSWSVTSNASNGSSSIDSSTGVLSYTPTTNFNGSDSLVIQVGDGSLTDTLTINLTISANNDAPVISGSSSTLTLSMVEDGTFAYDLNATDADDDSLSWSITSNASNGSSSIDSSTGVLSYTPTTNFNGSDSLVVQVSDGSLTDTLTINLTISANNDAPVISGSSSTLTLSMVEDDSFSYDLNGTDADSDTLAWSLSSAPSNGSSSIDSSTGVLSYTPTTNFNGSDSLVVQVSDGSLTDTLTINLSISASNDAPVISGSSSTLTLSMVEDGSFSYDLNGTDADSDTLAWSLSSAPSNGSSSIDSSTGVLSYTPTTNFNGSDTLVVQVSDGSLTHNISVNLVVVASNDAPSGITLSSASIEEDQSTGVEVGIFSTVDVDLNSVHSYSLVSGNGSTDNSSFSLDSNGTLKTGLVFDFETKSTYSIRLRTSDQGGLSFEKVFTITVTDKTEKTTETVVLLLEGVSISAGWKEAGWFGFYYAQYYPWVYHANLGWIYVSEDVSNGAWLYRETLGWLWTNPSVFPHMFRNSDSHWLFLDVGHQPTRYYDYSIPSWMSIE